MQSTKLLTKGRSVSTRNPIDVQKLTQRRVTVPAIMIVGLVVLGFKADNLTIGYLDDFFLTKAVAEEQYESITEQVAANTTLLTGHIRTYELNENAKDTRRVEDQLYDLELYVAANGTNDLATQRKRDLDRELSRLTRVRACIIRHDPNVNCAAVI